MLERIILSLLLVNLACLNSAKAQLKFRNTVNEPIEIAIAYYVKTEEFEGWQSIGWYYLEPGETKTLIAGDLKCTSYYYYAKDGKGTEWKGAGKHNFVIENTAFTLKNADKRYLLEKVAALRYFESFKKVEVGKAKTHTISLAEGED